MHDIQLKKIKVAEFLSEETTAFTAEIYIDSKKVGYCKNDGQGGCTDYYGYTKEDNQLIRECEDEFKQLPLKESQAFGSSFKFQPTFEDRLDELLEAHFVAKDEKKFEKSMETAILFGTEQNFSEHFWKYTGTKKRVPLQLVGLSAIQQKVDELKKTDGKILNTNLEKLGVKI